MDDCPAAAEFIASIPQHISSVIHILILALVFVNIVHSLAYAFLLVTHLWKVLASENPCDVYVSGVYCYTMRLITASSYTAHTTVLLGLLLERVIATRMVATYDKCTAMIGWVLLFATLALATSLSVLKQHKYILNQPSFYCSSVSASTIDDVLIVHCVLFLMLIAALIVFGLLFFLNAKIRRQISHDVTSKCQASENLRALRVLRPLLILHFSGYPLYFAISVVCLKLKKILGNQLFRVVFSALYFPSHYCLLSTLVLWYIIRKHKKEVRDGPLL
ncbi:hypothetical protein COOONC_11722 [Cooperia oncophora]